MKLKEKLSLMFKKDKRIVILVVLGVIAIALIVLSELLPAKVDTKQEQETVTTNTQTVEVDTEKRLSDIISQIDGAGKVKVMVTLDTSQEYEYAKNSTDDIKKDGENTDSKYEREYVLVDTSNGEECVLVKSTEPKIRGVIVVCDGGDIQSVKNNITNAVASALGVSTNNITVLKMKISEEK